MSPVPPRKVVVVDDDDILAELVARMLSAEGHDVTVFTDSEAALERIPDIAPDLILTDVMMPKVDGIALIKRLRGHPALGTSRFIVVSAKSYEFDRRQAYENGADGFINKSVGADEMIDRIHEILEETVRVTFWGVRGTLPRPGPDTLRYGGNTNCVAVTFSRERLFIFDAGSGIKALSNHLMASGKAKLSGKIFISHPHWDHINALPFFVPLYIPGNEFEIIGARHGDLSMREIASAQMDGVYFPITLKEFGARVYFRDVGEESFDIDGIRVATMMLSHPGICLGYRIEHGGHKVCYITDNELFLSDSEHHNPGYEKKLQDFCRGADLLITDSTYTDDEYKTKVTWGHSCLGKVAELAHEAEVKTLCLFHHDPDQDDDAIDRKLETVIADLEKRGSRTRCIAPAEGDTIEL